MSEVVLREKPGTATMEADANDTALEDTPPVIRELKNYHPFAATRSFRMSRIRRDSFIAEHRSIGVFTSGGDASGNLSNSLSQFLSVVKVFCPQKTNNRALFITGCF